LVCTSTVVWRWGHTSTTCCHRVMVQLSMQLDKIRWAWTKQQSNSMNRKQHYSVM